MLRVIFVCVLVALASAFITENLFADENIGLTREARDECHAQGLECVRIMERAELSFKHSINTLSTINTGTDYMERVCSAGNETIQCLSNLGSCAYRWMDNIHPKVLWLCGPFGRDTYARLDGTSCSTNPYNHTQIVYCLENLCTVNGTADCLRETWTDICSSAFAEIQFAMLFPNPCPS